MEIPQWKEEVLPANSDLGVETGVTTSQMLLKLGMPAN